MGWYNPTAIKIRISSGNHFHFRQGCSARQIEEGKLEVTKMDDCFELEIEQNKGENYAICRSLKILEIR
jgi:hypothetical protein